MPEEGPSGRSLISLAIARGLAAPEAISADAATLIRSGTISEAALSTIVREEAEKHARCPVCAKALEIVGNRPLKFACKACGVELGFDPAGSDLPNLDARVPEDVREAARRKDNIVGNFVVVRQVGSGGFGTVYRAWQLDLGRIVALKFLLSESPEDLQRFVREAQTAAKLSHPHIVPLYEVREHEGRHFLVMEFIEGQTLGRHPLAARRAAEIMQQVASAVHFAHEKGIIHRDVKPQNLMMGENGHVWVMDFGLARHIQGGTTLTMSGSVVGTPAYMPPEQAAGMRCDVRSDVYSLGATLYELLTGRPPFEGASVLEVLEKARSEEPRPPRFHEPGLDRELETIVLKAMDKTPSRRYGTAKDFALDLERHLAGQTILARPAGLFVRAWKWARRHPVASAIAALLIAGALVAGAVLVANAIRFRSKIRDLLARAAGAEEQGRYEEARGLYAEVRMLVPGHEVAEAKFYETDTAARAAEQRSAALLLLAKARKYAAEHDSFQAELAVLRSQQDRLKAAIEPSDGQDRKKPLWALQQRIEGLEDQANMRYADLVVALTQAAGVDPKFQEARHELAGLYFVEYEQAERAGDRLRLRANEKMVRFFDSPSFQQRLEAEGAVEIDSTPPGAEVYVFKFVEGEDRRLMPMPLNLEMKESRSSGAAGLEFSAYNRVGRCPIARTKMPQGSYLFVLRKPGFRDVRYPVQVNRGSFHAGRVNLFTEAEIGEGFVHVPAGRFVFGGDRGAANSAPRDAEAEVGDFFIRRLEVTVAEYAQFLNDREYHMPEQAWGRSPRDSASSGYRWGRSGDRIEPPENSGLLPVTGISWEDAREYCEWLTRRRGRAEKALFRLPKSVEWEKAARGVDGRGFPWGWYFDATFAKGGESRRGKAQLEAIGSFDTDESPYGVHDMAGSVREWCDDWEGDKQVYKQMRGGSWGVTFASDFRCASRFGLAPADVTRGLGIRVVKVPERFR